MDLLPNTDMFAVAADTIGPDELLRVAWVWGGFDDGRALYADSADAAAGRRRVTDMLYITGFRHPMLHVVSYDYLDWLMRFWRLQNPSLDGSDLNGLLAKVGLLPAGWPYHAMPGRVFQNLVSDLERAGNVIQPRLVRTVMPGPELDRLFARAREAEIAPAEMADMLVDFGGGVFSERHLDQAGFDRIELAIEAKVAGLWRPGDPQP